MRKIIVAVDGYAATGKTTTARGVAETLGYLYLDTGAMYRALAWYLHQQSFTEAEVERLTPSVLEKFALHMEPEGCELVTWVGERRLSEELRLPEIARLASVISTLPWVRAYLVQEQQRLGQQGGMVVVGRDIGTVVFPEAPLKVFFIASLEVRVERRYQELRQKGLPADREAIRQALLERDYRDETRPISPLRPAPDARILDTTCLTIPQQIERVVSWAKPLITVPALSFPCNS
ncbi:MAG: (d)CMP kinase [Bacteroidia bacterium]